MDLNIINKTPIHQLHRSLNNNSFYIKREDLIPFSFGGNKARKATLFFEDIKQQNSDCVVTYGSSSSNHCRIIANIAAAKDIPCYIISADKTNLTTSNKKLIDLFGAQITKCPVSQVSMTIDQKINELKGKGYNPYFIQGGGHGNIGTHAYVQAYEEIRNYESATNTFFDYIFFTSGTGTTHAGLVCGKALHGDNREIVGISNARKNPYGGNVVSESIKDYLVSHKISTDYIEPINFIDDYVLDGYGTYNNKILNVIRDVLINDGVPLDTTYTGKAFWGMQDYIKKNNIENKNILFIHTGGTPLFFDKLEDLKNE